MSSMQVCVEGTSIAVIEAGTESSYIIMGKVPTQCYYSNDIIIKKSLKVVFTKLVVPKECTLYIPIMY